MKKIFLGLGLAAVAAALFAGYCWTAGSETAPAPSEEVRRIGLLTYLGSTEEEFQQGLDRLREALIPLFSQASEENLDVQEDEAFLRSLVRRRRVVRFYDSLMPMIMALRAGKVDEIILPERVGRYVLGRHRGYEPAYSLNAITSSVAFGFGDASSALRDEFDRAIVAMREDGTLAALEKKYIVAPGARNQNSVTLDNFKGAPTIRFAVTGDLPPIDMFAGDGRPAGYNVGVLAELGRRLKKNIQLVNVAAGGRSAALASGKADAVFWYRRAKGMAILDGLTENPLQDVLSDAPEGVHLSLPYYEWKTNLIIRRTQ